MAVLIHQKIPHPLSPEEAFDWFNEKYFTDVPPYFLTHWKTGKEFFLSHGALYAYERSSKALVLAGEPLIESQAPQINPQGRLNSFKLFAQRQGLGVCGYYVGQNWDQEGFTKVPLGVSTALDLTNFSTQEPRAREVRRALRKGAELGFKVQPLERTSVNFLKVQTLYQSWQKQKGALRLGFLLSPPQRDHSASHYEAWYGIKEDGELIAFCSLLPSVKKGRLCFYLDNILHLPKGESMALSFLIAKLIVHLKKQNVMELNFGLSPFARISLEKTTWMEKFFSLLYASPFLYRPKKLHFFKKKFGGYEESAYCFFSDSDNSWRQLSEMAALTVDFGKSNLRNPLN